MPMTFFMCVLQLLSLFAAMSAFAMSISFIIMGFFESSDIDPIDELALFIMSWQLIESIDDEFMTLAGTIWANAGPATTMAAKAIVVIIKRDIDLSLGLG
jgi:hypothetical protein